MMTAHRASIWEGTVTELELEGNFPGQGNIAGEGNESGPSRWIATPKDRSISDFLRNLHFVFCSGWTNLHSHQQWKAAYFEEASTHTTNLLFFSNTFNF